MGSRDFQGVFEGLRRKPVGDELSTHNSAGSGNDQAHNLKVNGHHLVSAQRGMDEAKPKSGRRQPDAIAPHLTGR